MKEKQVVNELKMLALEAITNAGSGHSGVVMSSGDILYTLYTRHLISDGVDPLRDRFVISNGHGSAILYAMLASMGYFDMSELKGFRQYGWMLTGHPEMHTPGVEANTGPLGQGVANAVGMAIAETIMNARFGAAHYTYCLAGDGCLQEGVALEALSIAGLYKLNKFILLYDKNDITLDGRLDMSSIDDVTKKFEAMNFNVIHCDGHNIDKIDRAIVKAKKSTDKPTIIVCQTIIGEKTYLAGSHESHGKAFNREELTVIAKTLGVDKPFLDLTEETKAFMQAKKQSVIEELNNRKKNFILDKHKAKEYKRYLDNDFSFKVKENNKNLATRVANKMVLNEIAKKVDNIVVLSADLSTSTKVVLDEGGNYSAENRLGKNIAVGIREHAMGAIANGIALHGGFNVICSTFLAFSNYMMPPIRLAANMNLNVIFTFSHSSIYDSRNGVTHVPTEQLDQLRLIPNLTVWRPADFNECVTGYEWFFNHQGPMSLIVSRTALPAYPMHEEAINGGYYLINNNAKVNLISSGGELGFAVRAHELLKEAGISTNVVSVPSIEVFESQSARYKNKIMSKDNFVIESSPCVKYYKYAPVENIFSCTEFGVTGGEDELRDHFGFKPEDLVKKIMKVLKKRLN